MIKLSEKQAPPKPKFISKTNRQATKDDSVVRFSLELPVPVADILSEIQETGSLRTRTEAIIASVALTHWMVRHAKKGNIIGSINEEEGNYVELDSPLLTLARAKG